MALLLVIELPLIVKLLVARIPPPTSPVGAVETFPETVLALSVRSPTTCMPPPTPAVVLLVTLELFRVTEFNPGTRSAPPLPADGGWP